MTDEALIAWLRSLKGLGWSNEAADRIEALVKDKEQLGREVNMARYGQPDFAWSVHKEAMADLEAKLAKAVEALEVYACGPECADGKCYDTGDSCGQFATATLAEIKGESHE